MLRPSASIAVAALALIGLVTACGSGSQADHGASDPAKTKPTSSRATPGPTARRPKANRYAGITLSPTEAADAVPVPDTAYEPIREPTAAETQAAIDAKVDDQIAEACAVDSNNAMCESMMP